MREIKFRAWDKHNKTMLDRVDCDFESLASYVENDECYEVMQYTGLKDKNGVEIYEGDIIRFEPKANFLPVDHNGLAQVYWYSENDHAGYWIKDGKEFDYSIDILCGQNYEVIGNIYENPELLESDK